MYKKIIIVIPIYQSKLSHIEIVALKQLEKVLYAYDKVIIAPDDIILGKEKFYSNWPIERFSNRYFIDTVTYSELLLSVNFYKIFSQYEYMLIYQLDGFVFSDRLLEFCKKNYDYIGSAWPMNHRYSIGRKNAKVGNGGVSLRKISSMIDILSQKDYIVKKYNLEKMFLKVEDYFFSFCGSRAELNFSVPNIVIARDFCIDLPTDLSMFLRYFSAGKMPFCIHGWNKNGCVDYVRKYINSCGYSIVKENKLYDYNKLKKTYLSIYFIDRCIRYEKAYIQTLLKKLIKRKVVIWGGGTFGKHCKKILDYAGINIECCFDKNPYGCDAIGMKCCQPEDEMILSHKYFIIITPFAYEDVIEEDLQQKGLVAGKDYLKFSQLSEMIMKGYFDKMQ